MRYVSKTSYTEYLKCPKMLWYNAHGFEGKVSEFTQRTLDNGTEFGILARHYFGECAVVERNSNVPMTEQTRIFLERGAANIAEATFASKGGYCQADILHRNENGHFDLVEVKSASQIKPYYLDDISFQYYVIKDCVPIDKCFILHMNSQYRRQGELSRDLFVLTDVTNAVNEYLSSKQNKGKKGKVAHSDRDIIGETISAIQTLFEGDLPDLQVHELCDDWWECPFKDDCIRSLDEKGRSLMSLQGLTWKQRIKCLKKGEIVYPKGKEVLKMAGDETIISPKEIAAFLDTVKYPLYLLDFESIQNIVPMFDGQTPWQQTPFQYSLHIMYGPDDTKEKLIHREFLWEENSDPRPALVKQLVEDIPADACVMAYNMMFEKMVLADLAVVYPEYANHLNAIHDNCIDLMIPFKNRSYYKGDMYASYSIKNVLPSCYPDDPELNYHNLEDVQNGTMAQEKYLELIQMQPGAEKAALRNHMLKYCELDTFAMYKLLQFLYNLSAETPQK